VAIGEAELGALLGQLDVRHRFFRKLVAPVKCLFADALEEGLIRSNPAESTWLRVERRFYRGKVGLPKGRKKRSVRLSRELAQELWTLRKDTHGGADDLIFTSAKGKRIDPSNVATRILKPAARNSGGGDWVHHHTFRHTCATRLFRSGWNAAQVQLFLGHSDPASRSGSTCTCCRRTCPSRPSPSWVATKRQPTPPKSAETATSSSRPNPAWRLG
jgi:hypothetical protein